VGLPTPNYFYHFKGSGNSYGIGYLINGFFGTKKGYEYLNDIIARFILSIPIKERLMYPPSEDTLQHDRARELKEFQNLRSKASEIGRVVNSDWGSDQIFIELKFWIEYQIKNNGGEGSPVEFDSFLNRALSYYEFKDKSTAKAKCRNIWNWYEKRNWSYHILTKDKTNKTKEEIKVTRIERAKTNAKAKADKARKTVINAITGLYADEYKKKNGKWNMAKISRAINIDFRVVSKYINEFENQNKI
jgi:hypothetical protein